MAKPMAGPEASLSLLVVGGHAVGTALVEGHTKQAIIRSLGVAAVALIFMVVQILLDWVQKKGGRQGPNDLSSPDVGKGRSALHGMPQKKRKGRNGRPN